MRLYALFIALTLALSSQAQTLHELHRYDHTNSALEGHATQILQDRNGMFWISTWNGLYRFDGYDFIRLRPQAGDGCTMMTDRIRDIWLAEGNDIYLRADETIYRFNLDTYSFHDLTNDDERQQAEICRSHQPSRGKGKDGFFHLVDTQGLEWQLHEDALLCLSAQPHPCTLLDMPQQAMVRCIKADSKGRVWVTTKDDGSVRLLDATGQHIGYLTPEGGISTAYRSFGHPIYCITETSDGTLWLGSKPDGLFRLTEKGEGHFNVEPISGLDNTLVYGIAEDHSGRLWIATLGGGIACIEHPNEQQPHITNLLPGYPKKESQSVRHIYITQDNILLAATTEGLLVSQIETNVKNMRFHRHTKESERASSLSCNATMDIIQTPNQRLFVATETGGVEEILSTNLLTDTLHFRHYAMQTGKMPTDMTLGITAVSDTHLFIVCPRQMVMLNIGKGTYENLDHHFFNQSFLFSEGRPHRFTDSRWLLPTQKGALWLADSAIHRSYYQPPLLLTGITIHHSEGEEDVENLAVATLDTLVLSPSERSLTIRFAALDYIDPQAIKYQFKLNDEDEWENIGHNHSITLPSLAPGTYRLHIRSTNVDGHWTDNTRTLTIMAKPTFWETPWATLLFIMIGLVVVGSIVFTLLYIRRIKHRQQETLEAYLSLLEKMDTANEATPRKKTDDPFMQQVLTFVEQNIANGDADVSQMAEACAVSRSVLQRRMKQMMGVSPADFLREARIKHACQLLKNDDSIVSEVAYKCGFSDPKYFSRCFKQSVGTSPSEYRNQVREVE